MSSTIRPLFEPVQIAANATTYFVAGVPTRIEKMTLVNTDTGAAHNATIYLVPAGAAPGAANAILIGGTPGKVLQTAESYDVINAIWHALNPGDSIAAIADAASKVNFFCSGLQLS